jgi:hypothetical protein
MDFCKLKECEINYLVSALANALAEGLNKEEINFLSRFFSHLSGALQLIVSFQILCDSQKSGAQTSSFQTSNPQSSNSQTSDKPKDDKK